MAEGLIELESIKAIQESICGFLLDECWYFLTLTEKSASAWKYRCSTSPGSIQGIHEERRCNGFLTSLPGGREKGDLWVVWLSKRRDHPLALPPLAG